MLSKHHRDDLHRSGLNDDTIDKIGFESVDAAKIGRLCYGPGRTGPTDGYKIPYPGTDIARFRLGHEVEGQKYVSEIGSRHALFIPPGLEKVMDATDYLIVTEGEKKAARAVQDGYPAVAIPGVWMWFDPEKREAGGERLSPATPILPDLAWLARGRRVMVLADSDMHSNNQVNRAMTLLSQAISHQVTVKACTLQACPSPDGHAGSSGLDDALSDPLAKEKVDGFIDAIDGFPPAGWSHAIPYAEFTGSGLDYLKYLVPFPQPGKPILPPILKQVPDGDGGFETKATKAPMALLNRNLLVLRRDSEGLYRIHGGDAPAVVISEVKAHTDDRRDAIIRLKAEDLTDTEVLKRYGVSGSPAEAQEVWRAQRASGQVKTVRVCNDRGWINVEGMWHYLYGDQTLTPSGDEPVHADQSDSKDKGAITGPGGSEDAWKSFFRTLATHQPAQAVAAGMAASSPTLHFIGDAEPGMLHLYSSSSSGKTTTLQIVASIIGGGHSPRDKRSYIKGWRTTDNGLEVPLSRCNDSFICLDELHAAPKTMNLTSTAYMITNGLGKSRMSRSGEERDRPSWTSQIFSVGEKSFAEAVREQSKASLPGGLQFRVIDLHAGQAALTESTEDGMAAWSEFFGQEITCGRELAEAQEDFCAKNYGHAHPWIARSVMEDEGEHAGDLFAAWRDEFVAALPAGASPIIQRRTKHAALAMAGLQLLTEYTDMHKDDADKALSNAFKFCVNDLMPAGITAETGDEGESIMEALKSEISAQAHRLDRPGVDGQGAGNGGRLGWIDGSGTLHLPTTGGWVKLCQQAGVDADRAKVAAKSEGWSKSRRIWPGTKSQMTVMECPGYFEQREDDETNIDDPL